MRATRAYLASLGTTGLLVLSSVLLLVLGSTLVAFEGWPGGSESEGPESVVVQTAQVEPEPGTGPEQVAQVAAPAAESVAAAAPEPPAEAPAAGVLDGDAEGDGPGSPPRDVDGTPQPSPGPPNDPGDAPPPDRSNPSDPGGVPLPGGGNVFPPGDATLVDGLADGLENTTTYLGQDVVGQLSPDLGTLLTQAGQGLTDLVRALDGQPAPPR
jgi:hypothetical protein